MCMVCSILGSVWKKEDSCFPLLKRILELTLKTMPSTGRIETTAVSSLNHSLNSSPRQL